MQVNALIVLTVLMCVEEQKYKVIQYNNTLQPQKWPQSWINNLSDTESTTILEFSV